jgi:hypothetical protein
MAFIFNESDPGRKENRGRVVVLEQENAAGGSVLTVDGWRGFGSFKAIFTRVHVAEQTNHQFLHTLGDRIYLYVFGDRIGSLGLSGLAFEDNCSNNPKIGIAHVLSYYRRYKLTKVAEPLRVTIDPTTVLQCYLHSFQAATINAAEQMYQFHMNLSLLPENDERPDLAIDTATRPPGNPQV